MRVGAANKVAGDTNVDRPTHLARQHVDIEILVHFTPLSHGVIPAKAGIQWPRPPTGPKHWIPGVAGMTRWAGATTPHSSSTHTGAWSLAPGRPRTSRSTPASTSLPATGTDSRK